MGAINLKEGFTSLKHKIEKNPIKAISGVLAAVLLSGCVTIIAKDLVNSNPVAAAPQPTPRVTFFNTPIPTGVPTLEPTIIKPTEVPATKEVVKLPTSAVPVGGENASDPSKVSFLPELKPIIKSVGSANKGTNEGYGVQTSLGKVFNITDTNTGNKEPFVLKLENNKEYFVLAMGFRVDESSRFFDITDLKSDVTSIDVSALKSYKEFIKLEGKIEQVKISIDEELAKLGISRTIIYKGYSTYFVGAESKPITFNHPDFQVPSNGERLIYYDYEYYDPTLANWLDGKGFKPESDWTANGVVLRSGTPAVDYPLRYIRYKMSDGSDLYIVRQFREYFAKGVPQAFVAGVLGPEILHNDGVFDKGLVTLYTSIK